MISLRKKWLGAAVVLIALFYSSQIIAAYRNARQIKAGLAPLATAIYNRDWPQANNRLMDIRKRTGNIAGNVNRLWPLRSLPWIENEYRAVLDILSAADEASQAGVNVVFLLEKLPSEQSQEPLSDIKPDKTRELLAAFENSGPIWQELHDKTESALIRLQHARQINRIKTVKIQLDLLIAKLTKARAGFARLADAPVLVPAILGYPEEKTYLLLLQNNTELRPTGGFIGTYGILTLKDGALAKFSTDNVYNLDEPAKNFIRKRPPAPLQRFLSQKQWFLRDVNWDPDFPSTAELALKFYKDEVGSAVMLNSFQHLAPKQTLKRVQGDDITFDGVIAFTPEVIKDILAVLGPVAVDNYTFTDENLVDLLQYQVGVGFAEQGITVFNRKKIIDDVAGVLKDKLLRLTPADLGDLIPLLSTSLDEKHAMIYFRDGETQKLIADFGWDNRILETDHDYFYVVDANLGSLKTDPNIERKIEYTVETQGLASLYSTLSITYKNRGQFDWKTTRYRTYTRVYVPLSARLISASGNDRAVDITIEHGKTVFGTFISIEPGEQQTLSFNYKLPQTLADKIIKEKKYNLLIQKQAGTYAHTLSFDIAVPFPIQKISPGGIMKKAGNRQVKGSWDLTVDRAITIE